MAARAADAAPATTGVRRIAVAGNPNSGKTSVFNQLTGLRQKVGNYPGVTVEKREGRLAGSDVVLLDLPGTYSLSARSPDEAIARDLLLGRIPGIRRPDAVLLVIDAANLERNLYLTSQILEFGTPVVIACNMIDVARQIGREIDCRALERELGVPVIPTVGKTGEGIETLRRVLDPLPERRPHERGWRLPEAFEDAVAGIAEVMESSGAVPAHAVRAGALLWLMDYLAGDPESRQSAARFLNRLSAADAGKLRVRAEALAKGMSDPAATAIEARYAWISGVAARAIRRPEAPTPQAGQAVRPTDRIDRILTHRVLGLVFFAAVMFALFLSIFAGAQPLMNLIESGQLRLEAMVEAALPAGPVRSLLTDGILAGVGAVVAFFPQICILFLFLSVLEDSGYMARAAFLMDRLMSRVGLHGKSFIPLLSSYACAIPGILATRTIENRRDRFVTILIAPLMSCSARLPIYIIVIGAVFGDSLWLKAGVMFAMYLLGTGTALLTALVLKKTLFAGPKPAFILELPPYHMPQPRAIVRAMWDRSKLFLTGAGTTIFAASVVIWALSYFPRIDEHALSEETQTAVAALDTGDPTERDNLIAGEQLRRSLLGRLGRHIEPALEPLGFDWRIGVGILSSFLAREVFVSSMGITFSLGEADEHSAALQARLAEATWADGRPLLTPLVGVGVMVFYVLACQCVSTLAVVRRETGAWRWPALMFAYMTGLAYLGALAVHQVGIRVGWG